MYEVIDVRPISVKKLGQIKIKRVYVKVKVVNKKFSAIVSYFRHKHKYYLIVENMNDIDVYNALLERNPLAELVLPREIPKIVLNT